MKTSKLFLSSIVAMMVLFLMSCGGESPSTPSTGNVPAPPNADNAKITKIDIDIEKSVIKWKGYILNIKEHTGTLNLKSGGLKMKGNEVIGGGFVIDMNSMATTDSNYNAEKTSEGLIGHLKSPDFFDTAKFPIASVIFGGNGAASVTIKDKTNKEPFSNVKVAVENGVKVIKAKISFDRQNYGVSYQGSGDYIINDQIEVEVILASK